MHNIKLFPDDLEDLSMLLASFQQRNCELAATWTTKGDQNELVIELHAVQVEADSLSRLIDSIIDGTAENVLLGELQKRFAGLKMKVDILIGRWKAFHAKGIEI